MPRNYTKFEFLLRFLWAIASIAFRLSPRHCYTCRNTLLRLFGAKLGRQVRIYPTCKVQFPWNLEIGDNVAVAWGVTIYNLGKIKIGSQVIISQHAHLCAGTHDYLDPNFRLIKSGISIGDHVWVAADAFIGPDVQIAANTVIAARAVVTKSTETQAVYAGNPAVKVKTIPGKVFVASESTADFPTGNETA